MKDRFGELVRAVAIQLGLLHGVDESSAYIKVTSNYLITLSSVNCLYIRNMLRIPRYLEGSIPRTDQEDELDHVEDEIGCTNDGEHHHSNTTTGGGGSGSSSSSGSSSGTRFSMKYKKLTAALCEVVDDFGLVSFLPLNIQDKQVT